MSRPIGVSAIGSAPLGGAPTPSTFSTGEGYGSRAYGAGGYEGPAPVLAAPPQTIVAVGIATAEAFGSPAVSSKITAGGGYGGSTYGAIGYGLSAVTTDASAAGPQTIVGAGIASAEAFGTPTVVTSTTVVLTGIFGPGDIQTLWDDATTPGTDDSTDTSSVVLGLRFTVLADGHIVGARFYKSVANTGTHTASLWDDGGGLLATGTFTSESASGWQEMRFDDPVTVSEGDRFAISYLAPVGHYAADGGFFNGVNVVVGPLEAEATGLGFGPNGMYEYSGTHVYPTQTFNSTNYWVQPLYADTIQFGEPTITNVPPGAVIEATGIGSAETFGSPLVAPGVAAISPVGISSSEAFGQPALSSIAYILPIGIDTVVSEEFGLPTVTSVAYASPIGIPSAEALGVPALSSVAYILPNPIGSAEVFGAPALYSIAYINPIGLASAEVFGIPSLYAIAYIVPTGIGSAEAFGVIAAIRSAGRRIVQTIWVPEVGQVIVVVAVDQVIATVEPSQPISSHENVQVAVE